jgi:Bacterial low temperature requirement A protein (LtrA)
VVGIGRGWHVAPTRFAERHRLIVLIALGESIIAIGVGAGFQLTTEVMVAAALGIVVVSALWWLYFDLAALFARRRLAQATGLERARVGRDAYSYLHLPMIAGIVLFAFGLKTTLHHVGTALDIVPAVGRCAGAALYLLAHNAFPLANDGPRLPPPHSRHASAARHRPRRDHHSSSRGACARQRRLFPRRRVRGDPLPEKPRSGTPPRPRGLNAIPVALQGKAQADFVPRTCPQKARPARLSVASLLEHGV